MLEYRNGLLMRILVLLMLLTPLASCVGVARERFYAIDAEGAEYWEGDYFGMVASMPVPDTDATVVARFQTEKFLILLGPIVPVFPVLQKRNQFRRPEGTLTLSVRDSGDVALDWTEVRVTSQHPYGEDRFAELIEGAEPAGGVSDRAEYRVSNLGGIPQRVRVHIPETADSAGRLPSMEFDLFLTSTVHLTPWPL